MIYISQLFSIPFPGLVGHRFRFNLFTEEKLVSSAQLMWKTRLSLSQPLLFFQTYNCLPKPVSGLSLPRRKHYLPYLGCAWMYESSYIFSIGIVHFLDTLGSFYRFAFGCFATSMQYRNANCKFIAENINYIINNFHKICQILEFFHE